MYEQNSKSENEKWNLGIDLFIESIYKSDYELRQIAHNQKCYAELMKVRSIAIEYLFNLRKIESDIDNNQ